MLLPAVSDPNEPVDHLWETLRWTDTEWTRCSGLCSTQTLKSFYRTEILELLRTLSLWTQQRKKQLSSRELRLSLALIPLELTLKRMQDRLSNAKRQRNLLIKTLLLRRSISFLGWRSSSKLLALCQQQSLKVRTPEVKLRPDLSIWINLPSMWIILQSQTTTSSTLSSQMDLKL